MRKPFLISVDTEGDGLWWWRPGDPIRTENAKYLDRFQRLCECYGFKPTYLTNWEMAEDPIYCAFAKDALERGCCEIGMHLHAWNTPPFASTERELREDPCQEYLIEYGESVMCEKIQNTTALIQNNLGVTPVAHRAGRWAMDERYFRLLAENGYICDCSVTPLIDWSGHPGSSVGSRGSDYRRSPCEPFLVDCGGGQEIVEVPLTTFSQPSPILPDYLSVRLIGRELKRVIAKRPIQCRPTGSNQNEMTTVANRVVTENRNYLMFMIHSSELMPGGSPLFGDGRSIDRMYGTLENLFASLVEHYEGETIGDYARRVRTEWRAC